VGSSNLNVASWLGNYEMDVIVEDVPFARAMMAQYTDDLTNATEVVLHRVRRGRVGRVAPLGAVSGDARARVRPHARGGGSAGRAAAGAIRLGNTITAAVTDRRVLAPADGRIVAAGGAILIAVAVVAMLWPRVFAIPLAVLLVWFGAAMVVRAYHLYRRAQPVVTGPTDSARDRSVVADDEGAIGRRARLRPQDESPAVAERDVQPAIGEFGGKFPGGNERTGGDAREG
jgi:cardiolipin synthase